MGKFLSSLEAVNEWTGRVLSWTVAVLTVIVIVEVVLRYFFNSPTVCNFEITKQLYGFYFMIVAGYTLLHKGHVSVDIIHSHLSKRNQDILDVISYLIFFFPFCTVVIFYGGKFAIDSWKILETSWSECAVPLYPIKTIVPLSFLFIFIQGLVFFMSTLLRLFKGEYYV